MSLQHLQAIGIQLWQLKPRIRTPYLLVCDEAMSGKSSQLFHAMLDAMDLNKEQMYTTLSLKTHIAHLNPNVLMVMGEKTAQTLLNCNHSIETLRENIHHFSNIPLIVTYHPTHLLKYPLDKIKAYQDIGSLLNSRGDKNQ